MQSSTDPRKRYETALVLRHNRGEQLSPEELQRLADGDKRFNKDFLAKLGITYVIVLPIVAALLYKAIYLN